MEIRELKHAAQLREWSGRIAECRSSRKNVKEWCEAQGIITKTYYYWEKQFVTEASRQLAVPVVNKMHNLCHDPGKRLIPGQPAGVHDIQLRVDLPPVPNYLGPFFFSSQVAR